VPVIGLVQVGGQAMADRYAYLPFIGLFTMAVWGTAEWATERISQKLLAAAGILILAAFSVVTYIQISYWHDSITLWSHALAVTEGNFVAHDNLGNALVTLGRYDEALVHFQAAAAINPKDPLSQLNIGAYQLQHGQVGESIARCLKVLQLTSDRGLRANALGNLGSAYRRLGDYARAKESYEAALRLDSSNAFILIGLAVLAQRSGDLARARDDYSRAVALQPTDVGYLLLAQALEKSGHSGEAQAARQQAEKLTKDLGQAQETAQKLLSE